MRSKYRAIIVPTVLLLLSACAPVQSIRPYPDFIRAGVMPGDRIQVETTSGERLTITVEAIDDDSLVAGSKRLPFADIAAISKRAWRIPKQACGGSKPLGCSVPQSIDSLVDPIDEVVALFHPACVQHDFCYRHGAKTYGRSRLDCDTEFRQLMVTSCDQQGLVSKIGWFSNPASCRAIAQQMYRAVRDHGEKRFLDQGATYCEYDGPPEQLTNAGAH